MAKCKWSFSILTPAATVFFSSACIMALELVAGRLVARSLGASLYTWTSAIGVVLTGISIGNYLGGRVADRFPPHKALSVLFGMSSATCAAIVLSNNLMSSLLPLWRLALPVRVFAHVFTVFLIPSSVLGAISPVVAKMALDRGLPTGRTVGDIYAWAAAGSIVGTFLAGFFLISAIGTVTTVWAIGAALLLMGILHYAKHWGLYLWGAILIIMIALGTSPARWARRIGSTLALREKPDPHILYETESQYSYIAVRQLSIRPDTREFVQDNLKNQSIIIMDNVRDVQAFYEQIFAGVAHLIGQDKDTLSVLAIGGGGYVIPRYIRQVWPGSRIDVAEIDPEVTQAATRAFGLEKNTAINTYAMDGRNYVEGLLKKHHRGAEIPRYDLVYEDAFSGFSVPYQLVTKEFNDEIAKILKDDGLYVVNLIDVFNIGEFAGAVVNTLEQTFPYVQVVSEQVPRDVSHNFVVIAASQKIDLRKLPGQQSVKSSDLWILSNTEVQTLKKRARGILLTDDYAPVENLLARAAVRRSVTLLALEHLERAEALKRDGKWEESIARYREVISVEPAFSIRAYNEIGRLLAAQGRWEEAIEAAKSALAYNEKTQLERDVSDIHHNIGTALKTLGKNEQAMEYMLKAVQGYRRNVAKKPTSIQAITRLGNALAQIGDFDEAVECFQRVVRMDPSDVENYLLLAKALMIQVRHDDAVVALEAGIRLMQDRGREDDAARLQSFLRSVKAEKSKSEK